MEPCCQYGSTCPLVHVGIPGYFSLWCGKSRFGTSSFRKRTLLSFFLFSMVTQTSRKHINLNRDQLPTGTRFTADEFTDTIVVFSLHLGLGIFSNILSEKTREFFRAACCQY